MKYLIYITFVFVLNVTQVNSQTNTNLISDKEYKAFFIDLKQNLKTNRIETKIEKYSIISKNNPIIKEWSKYFTKEDIVFQNKQINLLKTKKNIPANLIDNVHFISDNELKIIEENLSEKNAYYSLRYPIFSKNKKLAGIWIKYNCGNYCSENKLILYKKVNNHWKEYKTLFHMTW
ncbi:hypothetical protein [Flavobacterium sp. LC2016-01]|uniref:hypothetical protein n=1 Tax=Flavobacterium sp. LC2016-01 TaxID=2675876 RepID=UPI0012BB1B71|nr:hypothetical protein [Flavobacterium sp. LC2016-01]MTH14274.1 hypothetical protein [Flavobacterium sp. LC2016-01]